MIIPKDLKEFKWVLPDKAVVQLRENERQKQIFLGCVWWTIKYRWARFSIYYDPKDRLGIVGSPYFEIMAEDTQRFLCTDDGIKQMFDFIAQKCAEHDLRVASNPEEFL